MATNLSNKKEVLWPNKHSKFYHVEDDENAWHYVVYIDQKLICVVSVFSEVFNKSKNVRNSNNEESACLRKFATLTSYQNQGIASFVLIHIIESFKE